jgi:hypothetical protein
VTIAEEPLYKAPQIKSLPKPLVWTLASFGAACFVAISVLGAVGTGVRGINMALAATGRLSLLLFLPAYTGSALVTLFGSRFRAVQRNGREFGLAFAAAHLVHLGLVWRLCAIGAAPATGVFVLFGIAVFSLYLLVLLSLPTIVGKLAPRDWRLLRLAAMTYIAYAFAVDFVTHPLVGIKQTLAYLPFSAMIVAAFLLRIAAFAIGPSIARRRGGSERR